MRVLAPLQMCPIRTVAPSLFDLEQGKWRFCDGIKLREWQHPCWPWAPLFYLESTCPPWPCSLPCDQHTRGASGLCAQHACIRRRDTTYGRCREAPKQARFMLTCLFTPSARDLDMYVTEMAAALPVDVMPGTQDPTNVAMPQQPLHKCAGHAAHTCVYMQGGASGVSSIVSGCNHMLPLAISLASAHPRNNACS